MLDEHKKNKGKALEFANQNMLLTKTDQEQFKDIEQSDLISEDFGK